MKNTIPEILKNIDGILRVQNEQNNLLEMLIKRVIRLEKKLTKEAKDE